MVDDENSQEPQPSTGSSPGDSTYEAFTYIHPEDLSTFAAAEALQLGICDTQDLTEFGRSRLARVRLTRDALPPLEESPTITTMVPPARAQDGDVPSDTAHDVASDTPPGSPAAPSHVGKPACDGQIFISTPPSAGPNLTAIADMSETGPSHSNEYVRLRAEYRRLKTDLADIRRDYRMVGDRLSAAKEKLVTASSTTFLSYYEWWYYRDQWRLCYERMGQLEAVIVELGGDVPEPHPAQPAQEIRSGNPPNDNDWRLRWTKKYRAADGVADSSPARSENLDSPSTPKRRRLLKC